MTILEKIIANKRREVSALLKQTTLKEIERGRFFDRETNSLKSFLTDTGRTGIIAEFKRKSPSKGIINLNADVAEVTKGYAQSGASALSVLTDKEFFGGNLKDLVIARENNTIPILRKEFIIDEFQVVESKAIGADAVLLIASVLSYKQVLELAKLSHSLGLEVILEIHTKREITLVNEHIDIIGVNNRDLETFVVDSTVSVDMAGIIPSQFLKISESGISTPAIIRSLKQAGYAGFLIGEKFMTNENPVTAFNDFIKDIF
jgi:indole-3-glycerol phosphate synthase